MSSPTHPTLHISSITASSLRARKYASIFPEYYVLEQVVEHSPWHDHQDVLTHVIDVYENLEHLLAKYKDDEIGQYLLQISDTKPRSDLLKIATLLHDIAKIDTLIQKPDGSAGCPGHELIGAARVKHFAPRFGLTSIEESYVERIVLYHGFTSKMIECMSETGDKDKYLSLFVETVGDVALELVLLMHADILGCDLKTGDPKTFDEFVELIEWVESALGSTFTKKK